LTNTVTKHLRLTKLYNTGGFSVAIMP